MPTCLPVLVCEDPRVVLCHRLIAHELKAVQRLGRSIRLFLLNRRLRHCHSLNLWARAGPACAAPQQMESAQPCSFFRSPDCSISDTVPSTVSTWMQRWRQVHPRTHAHAAALAPADCSASAAAPTAAAAASARTATQTPASQAMRVVEPNKRVEHACTRQQICNVLSTLAAAFWHRQRPAAPSLSSAVTPLARSASDIDLLLPHCQIHFSVSTATWGRSTLPHTSRATRFASNSDSSQRETNATALRSCKVDTRNRNAVWQPRWHSVVPPAASLLSTPVLHSPSPCWKVPWAHLCDRKRGAGNNI